MHAQSVRRLWSGLGRVWSPGENTIGYHRAHFAVYLELSSEDIRHIKTKYLWLEMYWVGIWVYNIELSADIVAYGTLWLIGWGCVLVVCKEHTSLRLDLELAPPNRRMRNYPFFMTSWYRCPSGTSLGFDIYIDISHRENYRDVRYTSSGHDGK